MPTEFIRVVNPGEWEGLEIGLRLRAKEGVHLAIHAMRDSIIDDGVHTAHKFLDMMIYNAPLPPSAAGREAWYVRHRRLKNLRDSIKTTKTSGPIGAEGTIYVDEEEVRSPDKRHYFYAVSVEYGVASMNYWARPFFAATVAVLKIKFEEEADLASRRIVAGILGRAL